MTNSIEYKNQLESVCVQYGDKNAITYMRNDGTKTYYTFKQILELIQNAEKQFETVGLIPGDRAAIIVPHSPFAIFAGLSLAYSNITSVLIDAALPTEEINRLLEISDVRAVFTVSNIYNHLDKTLIVDIPVFNISTIVDKLVLFEESTASVKKYITTDPQLDVITILFSSGTTSGVKGVMITYFAFLESIKLFIIPSEITDESSFLYVLPFYHMAGFTGGLACLFSGCDVGMIEDMDSLKIQKSLIEYQPSVFSMVPRVFDIMAQKIKSAVCEKGIVVETIINLLLSLSGFFRKHIGINLGRHIFAGVNKKVFGENFCGIGTGASLCSKDTTRFFLNLGFKWANFYSLTETNVPTVSTAAFERYPDAGVGRINRYDDIRIKIHNPDENGIGEIRVKTILIMKGYFRDPELTTAAFDDDGYFKTGDLGYIDKKSNLHITGRTKEAIHMHTGKKIAPSDVDSYYIGLLPDAAFASCGVPDKNGIYDEIHLFIERENLSTEEQQVIKRSIMDLSGQSSTLYQISGIHFIDKLPMTSVGKVKRFILKDIAIAEREVNE